MGGEGGGTVKGEEAEHKLIAVGSLVVQRVHADHGSDALSPSSSFGFISEHTTSM